MTNTFAAQATTGKAAVLNYASAYPFNDAAFTDPVNNLGSYKFHSGLYYLGCNTVLTGSVDMNVNNGWSSPAPGVFTKQIATHGLGYAPILMGSFVIGGASVPANAGIIAKIVSSAIAFMAIDTYADATGIYMSQTSLNGFAPGATYSISFTFYLCNMGDNGSGLVVPPFYTGLTASPTQFKIGYFDPQTYRYFYQSATGPITLFRGRSLEVDVGSYPASSSYYMLGVTQRVGSYVQTALDSNLAFDSAFNRTWPGTDATFTPSVYNVDVTPIGAAGLTVQPGLIKLGNGFNSSQNTLLISNYITTSIAMPTRSTSGGGIYQTDTFDLGACHPNATLLLGTYNRSGQWRSVNGTAIHTFGAKVMGPSATYAVHSPGTTLPAVGQIHFLSIQAGRVIATVRTFVPAGLTQTISGGTFTYRIFAGTFDY